MLTKRQALKKCIEMWDWLAEHPHADKVDYLQTTAGKNPAQDCYACEYAYQRRAKELDGPFDIWPDQHSCKHCPVWDQKGENDEVMCLNYKSPFAMWNSPSSYIDIDIDDEDFDATYTAHRYNTAKAVADMARAKLAELKLLKCRTAI